MTLNWLFVCFGKYVSSAHITLFTLSLLLADASRKPFSQSTVTTDSVVSVSTCKFNVNSIKCLSSYRLIFKSLEFVCWAVNTLVSKNSQNTCSYCFEPMISITLNEGSILISSIAFCDLVDIWCMSIIMRKWKRASVASHTKIELIRQQSFDEVRGHRAPEHLFFYGFSTVVFGSPKMNGSNE